jgi:hypothetical protein
MMLIVPGFFRARTGLLVEALNRPHTLEGATALSLMGREIALAAGVSLFGSMVMGKEDEWFNAAKEGPASSRFMNIFGDGFRISTMPNNAGLKIFAGLIEGGPYGDVDNPLDRLKILETAMESRMSPVASSVYSMWKMEDFLGRKYRNNWQALLDQTKIITPIFVEQMIEGATENGFGGSDFAVQSVSEFFGRTYVPQPVEERLDEKVKKYLPQEYEQGVRWDSLLPSQKEAIRLAAGTEISDLETERESEILARQDDIGLVRSQVMGRIGNLQQTMYKENLTIDGVTTSMEAWDDAARTGQISKEEWAERYNKYKEIQSGRYDELSRNLELLGGKSLEEVKEERKKKEDNQGLVWIAMAEMGNLNIDDFKEEKYITASDGSNYTVQVINHEKYDKARDGVLAGYDEKVKAEALARMDAYTSPYERIYNKAKDELDGYFSINKYLGYGVPESDSIDRYRRVMDDTIKTIRSYGLTDKEADSKSIRSGLVLSLVKQGHISSRKEAELALAAYNMESDQDFEDRATNPMRPAWVINHPDMAEFYPWTAGDVPTQLKQLLAPEVRPQVDLSLLKESPFE